MTAIILALALAAPHPCSLHRRWIAPDGAYVLNLSGARIGGLSVPSVQLVDGHECVHSIQLLTPYEGTAGFISGADVCPRLPTLFTYSLDVDSCTLTVTADSTRIVLR